MRAQITIQHTSLLNYCEAYNNNLPTYAQHEINQRILNALFIKHGRRDTCTAADYNALRLIANQCPSVAGATRDYAIGLLPANESPYYRSEYSQIPSGCEQQRGISNIQAPIVTPLQLIPNPAIGEFRVIFPHVYTGSLTITDLAGRIVFAQQLQRVSQVDIPAKEMPSGSYLVRAKGYAVSKLIITH